MGGRPWLGVRVGVRVRVKKWRGRVRGRSGGSSNTFHRFPAGEASMEASIASTQDSIPSTVACTPSTKASVASAEASMEPSVPCIEASILCHDSVHDSSLQAHTKDIHTSSEYIPNPPESTTSTFMAVTMRVRTHGGQICSGCFLLDCLAERLHKVSTLGPARPGPAGPSGSILWYSIVGNCINGQKTIVQIWKGFPSLGGVRTELPAYLQPALFHTPTRSNRNYYHETTASRGWFSFC